VSPKLSYAYSTADLVKVVAFLEDGFGWGADHSARILQQLATGGPEIPKAAYLQIKGEIKIALLLFCQAQGVINLSSWYAVPDFRGLFSVNFARMLVRDLQGACLTNYTPSREAYAIFKAMGFEGMQVHHRRLGIIKKFPFFALHAAPRPGQTRPTQAVTFAPLGQAGAGQVSYRIQQVKKSIFRLRTIDYYLDRPEAEGVPLWPLIGFALRKGCLQVNLFIPSTTPVANARWLVKDALPKGAFIFPSGSELCLDARR
jgi:hypothetical protein